MSPFALSTVADPPPRLLTPREVAEILRCSPSMVRALSRRGELRAVHVGRLPRFRREDVEVYIARGGL